jgi:hypothetical protein
VAIVRKLEGALAESLQSPELRHKLGEAGATVAAPGVVLGTFQGSEIGKYRRIVEFAKIRE